MDIKDFLLARIAEDEALAKKGRPNNTGLEVLEIDDYGTEALGISEARILAECAAKRAIVEQWDDPAFSDQGAYDSGHARAMDDAVRSLAAVYADHPDYRQEWAAHLSKS